MTDTTTGTEILRQTLFARSRGGYLARLARDHGLALASLEEFTHGRAKLPQATLDLLAKELHDAALDPGTGMLRRLSTNVPTPLSAPNYPPAMKPQPLPPPSYPNGPGRGPQPVKPEPVSKKIKRPGWVD